MHAPVPTHPSESVQPAQVNAQPAKTAQNIAPNIHSQSKHQKSKIVASKYLKVNHVTSKTVKAHPNATSKHLVKIIDVNAFSLPQPNAQHLNVNVEPANNVIQQTESVNVEPAKQCECSCY